MLPGCTSCNAHGMESDDDLVRRREAGRWLRSMRERRGFPTGEALAQRIGVTPGVISRYETGASRVPDERAEQIAEALDLDIITVRRNLGLWVPPEQATDSPPAGEDPREREALDLIAKGMAMLEERRRERREGA